MRNLIQNIAQALVGHPEEVHVAELNGGKTAIFELTVAKEDRGRIIGKQGQTIKSLRTILSAASSKHNRKIVLEIVE